jgi:Transglycosylase SLT domain
MLGSGALMTLRVDVHDPATTRRCSVGAIGIMQLMPATGAELRVGDITQIEPNIHAGTKYMGQLMSKYFPDAKFGDFDRPLFAFASTTPAPVELHDCADKVGLEVTTCVRNIFKYYVACTLTEAVQLERQNARKGLKGAN